MTASVTAATPRRRVQLMPRPIHHNNAHPIRTGMMISSCIVPTHRGIVMPLLPPTLTPPPILMQVSEPSTRAKPGP